MTNDEMENLVNFIVSQQAQTAVKLDRLTEKVDALAVAQNRAEERWTRTEERWTRTEESIRALLTIAVPAGQRSGRLLFASGVLLEAGVLGLFVTLLGRSAWTPVFALVIVAALGMLVAHVMMRARAFGRPARDRIDFGALHDASAIASLAGAIVIGLGLGASIVPSMAAAFQTVSHDELPRATSGLNTIQRLAGAIGTAYVMSRNPAPAKNSASARVETVIGPIAPPCCMRAISIDLCVLTCGRNATLE